MCFGSKLHTFLHSHLVEALVAAQGSVTVKALTSYGLWNKRASRCVSSTYPPQSFLSEAFL